MTTRRKPTTRSTGPFSDCLRPSQPFFHSRFHPFPEDVRGLDTLFACTPPAELCTTVPRLGVALVSTNSLPQSRDARILRRVHALRSPEQIRTGKGTRSSVQRQTVFRIKMAPRSPCSSLRSEHSSTCRGTISLIVNESAAFPVHLRYLREYLKAGRINFNPGPLVNARPFPTFRVHGRLREIFPQGEKCATM